MRINFINPLFVWAVLLLCSTSLFAHDFKVDGICYNFTFSNEVEVDENYGGYSGAVIIPEKVIYNGVVYNVTWIGDSAFRDCSGLNSVEIPKSVTSMGDEAFSGCSGLTSVVIGNGVKSIGRFAFCECSGLTSVVIGNSVTSIGYRAFYDCGSMAKIICNAITPPTCGPQVFDYIDKNTTTLMVPNGAMSAYQSAAQWSDFFNIEHIPTSIEGVKADARGDGTSPVYNLQGVRMRDTDNLPAGIYIRGGKKFMVK